MTANTLNHRTEEAETIPAAHWPAGLVECVSSRLNKGSHLTKTTIVVVAVVLKHIFNPGLTVHRFP